MGFFSTLTKLVKSGQKIHKQNQKLADRAVKANQVNISTVVNLYRIMQESINIVKNTKNYSTKVMRYKLIEDHLIKFNNTDRHPHFAKTNYWAQFVDGYYNGLNQIVEIDEARTAKIDSLMQNRKDFVCPHCGLDFTGVTPKAGKCPNCNLKHARYRVNKDTYVMVKVEEREAVVNLEYLLMKVPIVDFLDSAICLSDEAKHAYEHIYDKLRHKGV